MENLMENLRIDGEFEGKFDGEFDGEFNGEFETHTVIIDQTINQMNALPVLVVMQLNVEYASVNHADKLVTECSHLQNLWQSLNP